MGSDDDAKRNLVTASREKLLTRCCRIYSCSIRGHLKINTAVKKREKWLHDGNDPDMAPVVLWRCVILRMILYYKLMIRVEQTPKLYSGRLAF